jgi:glyoxylase-like metal-dependent hydrolase (beta-lactamase superfamily II)
LETSRYDVNLLAKFDENIWLSEVALEGFDVRGALILGEKRAVIWDTLSHPRDMQNYAPLIGDKDLVIVYSHADWDHIWGTAGLPHQPAIIIGHTACRSRFSDDVPATLREKRAAEPTLWDDVQLIPPNLTFQGEISLDLGAITLTLYHLEGHTADSIVAFLPEQGVLFMGDTVETPFPVLSPSCPLSHWIAELQRWESDPRVSTVIPSHGPVGEREILQRNIVYLQDLLDGRQPSVPEGLTEFYRETHLANIQALYT